MSSSAASPLSPRSNIDPLGHLSKSDFKSKPNALKNVSAFYNVYDKIIDDTPKDNDEYAQTIFVKQKDQPGGVIDSVKIYETNGSSNAFNRLYEEYKIVKELQLATYKDIFYNDETKQIYIQQPVYSQNLFFQMRQNANYLNSEYAVKMLIGDILDKIWIIHNCGYVHGDVRPQNIAKSALNNNEQDSGWIFTNFCLKRHKSKGAFIGCVGWSAPEIEIDCVKNKYKCSSDIFSLGLLILFCLFGEQPLQISEDERIKFGQNLNVCDKNEREKKFKKDLENKMNHKWYYENVQNAQNKMKNYLVKLYYDEKISLSLFKLLHDGMLIWREEERWNCQQIYDCDWFDEVRTQNKRKKVKKLRISIV